MYLTLDSSTIVASLRKNEENHKECRTLLEKVKDGKFIALEPYIVLVEVAAAIRRRTNSKELAGRVKNDLEEMETIFFFDLVKSRADKAIDIAKQTGVRGMDAVVIQIAKENDASLVSLDKEMVEKAKLVVKIKDVEDLIG